MDKLRTTLSQNREKVEGGMDKAAGAADSMTKGKYRNKIETGTDKAKGAVKRFSGNDEGGGSGSQGPGRTP